MALTLPPSPKFELHWHWKRKEKEKKMLLIWGVFQNWEGTWGEWDSWVVLQFPGEATGLWWKGCIRNQRELPQDKALPALARECCLGSSAFIRLWGTKAGEGLNNKHSGWSDPRGASGNVLTPPPLLHNEWDWIANQMQCDLHKIMLPTCVCGLQFRSTSLTSLDKWIRMGNGPQPLFKFYNVICSAPLIPVYSHLQMTPSEIEHN